VEGVNVFESFHSDFGDIVNVFPSVVNTGPQGLYVHHILMKAFELSGGDVRDPKIPEELLTMVITFDKDGNPVSSVDLTKLGLSMPVITPKPDKYYRGEYNVVFPHETEAPANTAVKTQNAKEGMQKSNPDNPDDIVESKSKRTWLYLMTTVLIIGIGGFYAWRKRKTNN
jgi:hypothetical protein